MPALLQTPAAVRRDLLAIRSDAEVYILGWHVSVAGIDRYRLKGHPQDFGVIYSLDDAVRRITD